MTPATRYLFGLSLVALAGAVVAMTVAPPIQGAVVLGLTIALAVQTPLGWWTLQSIGTERFQLVWVSGMLIRLAVVAIIGLVLVPAFGWQMTPTLGAVVATMLAMLLVEAVTAVSEHSGIKRR